jgi:hypothetical protein
MTPLARAVVILLGVSIFAAGVVAVFATSNQAGSTALVALGAAVCAFAFLGDRVQSVGVGGVSITMRDITRETSALAARIEREGDPEAAAQLRRLTGALQDLAAAYRRLRGAMRPSRARTRALDLVMQKAMRMSQVAALDAAEVSAWFDEGTPEARITALALMLGNDSLRHFDAVLESISQPFSPFEQYYGLHLAKVMLEQQRPAYALDDVQRVLLFVVVTRALRRLRIAAVVKRDRTRTHLAAEICDELTRSPSVAAIS